MVADKKDDGDHLMLQCAACLKEIPPSLAQSFEAQDYVHYFCGLDCRETWENKSKDKGTAGG